MGNLLPFVKQASVETLAQWELSGRAADMIVNANDIILVRISFLLYFLLHTYLSSSTLVRAAISLELPRHERRCLRSEPRHARCVDEQRAHPGPRSGFLHDDRGKGRQRIVVRCWARRCAGYEK